MLSSSLLILVGSVAEWDRALFLRSCALSSIPTQDSVVTPLDKAFYGNYLCLVASNNGANSLKDKMTIPQERWKWNLPSGCGHRPIT